MIGCSQSHSSRATLKNNLLAFAGCEQVAFCIATNSSLMLPSSRCNPLDGRYNFVVGRAENRNDGLAIFDYTLTIDQDHCALGSAKDGLHIVQPGHLALLVS